MPILVNCLLCAYQFASTRFFHPKNTKNKSYLVVKVEALRDPGGLDGDGGGLGDGVPVLGEGAHGAVTQHHPGVVTEGAHRDTLRSGINILPQSGSIKII